MKIAMPIENNRLCMHFGHCQTFMLTTVNDTKQVVGSEEIVPPPHEPGLLPKWLHEKGVTVIIAGGMGMRAQQLFQQYGIQVVTGAPPEPPLTILVSWLKGSLVTGTNVCDH